MKWEESDFTKKYHPAFLFYIVEKCLYVVKDILEVPLMDNVFR